MIVRGVENVGNIAKMSCCHTWTREEYEEWHYLAINSIKTYREKENNIGDDIYFKTRSVLLKWPPYVPVHDICTAQYRSN